MKKKILKTIDRAIVIALGLAGITNSCRQVDEYGTPYADYEIIGTVTSRETGEPIPKINILRKDMTNSVEDETFTNSKGHYHFTLGREIVDSVKLTIRDEDGEENGGYFEQQDIKFAFSHDDIDDDEDSDGWYVGHFVKTIDIKLDKKEQNE